MTDFTDQVSSPAVFLAYPFGRIALLVCAFTLLRAFGAGRMAWYRWHGNRTGHADISDPQMLEEARLSPWPPLAEAVLMTVLSGFLLRSAWSSIRLQEVLG